MLLHCTLIRGQHRGGIGLPLELTIDMSDTATGADVEAAVSRRFGTTGLTVAGVPLATITAVAGTLCQGAVLVDSSAASHRDNGVRRRHEPEGPILTLVVHTGAGAGSVFPLQRGTYRIGRSGPGIVIADPEMSREHALLEISDTTVTITDLGSVNGTLVDGHRRHETVVSTDSAIRCGNSLLTISSGIPALSHRLLEEAGTSVAEPLPVMACPPPANRISLLVTAAVPLIVGIGLAAVTGIWMFLAFSAMSGVAVLLSVFSGRRQRREFKESLTKALRQDQDRRRRAAPSVAELLSGHANGRATRPEHSGDCCGAWLRLGQGEQDANIRFEPNAGGEAPPSAGLLPVTLNPNTPQTTVRGPAPLQGALLRSLLLQLSYVPGAACTRVVVHGRPGQIPLAARFLGNVQLSSDVERTAKLLDAAARSGRCHLVLLLTDTSEAPEGLIGYAAARSWQVLRFMPSGSDAAPSDIELSEHHSFFTDAGVTLPIIPDLVAAPVFDRAARARKTVLSIHETMGIPASCSITQVLSITPTAISERWARGRSGRGLRAPLGIAENGTHLLDLEADGPHILIAGTTGAGKSELLRGLTAGLALCYPPDRVNFLFVDFKGGSGLAPLTGLPHCVGLLTDLSPDELDRFLASLRSEVSRRERLLASAHAPDLASYRQSRHALENPMPQLILMIDEFRMLVEDAPSALNELMRIATVGRSLGIHLVMATQRPQGAITADIRANVTSSIALRVQSDVESIDVINSRLAAGIDPSAPGRAFLSRGAGAPEEFQAVSLALAGSLRVPAASVRIAEEAIAEPASLANPPSGATPLTPVEAAAPLVQAMACLWSDLKGALPRRPVATSLPAELAWTGTPQNKGQEVWASHHASGSVAGADPDCVSISLGILDKPGEQRLAPLEWSLCSQGHLALVGSPALGGQSTLLVLAIEQLLRQPAESHLYLLDGLGSLDRFVARGRIGAKAGVHELRRGVRVLERIHQEMASRLTRPAGDRGTRIVLIIAGWGAWVSALRSGPLMWAEDLVQDIVRDGSHANITAILSGDRELVTSRFFAAVQNRIYCPAGSTEESRSAWPSLPRTAQNNGRAVIFGPAALGGPSVCQLYTSRAESLWSEAFWKSPALPPFRVEPLPAMLGEEFLSHVQAAEQAAPRPAGTQRRKLSGGQRKLVLGVGGDELNPVTTRFPAGTVLAVLGRPGSGRSSVARALPVMNPEIDWIVPGAGDDPAAFWTKVHASAAAGIMSSDATCLVDDADRLPASTNQLLQDLHARGLSVLVTAAYSSTLFQRVPVAVAACRNGAGLLLAPRSLADGDVFGTRFDVEPAPPPGRAVLVADGQSSALQLPYLPIRGRKEGRGQDAA